MAQCDLGTQLVEALRLSPLGALGALPVCSGQMWPTWAQLSLIHI